MKPERCGLCERYQETEHGGFCTPVKGKYGYEPVSEDQKPSVNCPYEYSHCSCGAPLDDGNCTDSECSKHNSENK